MVKTKANARAASPGAGTPNKKLKTPTVEVSPGTVQALDHMAVRQVGAHVHAVITHIHATPPSEQKQPGVTKSSDVVWGEDNKRVNVGMLRSTEVANYIKRHVDPTFGVDEVRELGHMERDNCFNENLKGTGLSPKQVAKLTRGGMHLKIDKKNSSSSPAHLGTTFVMALKHGKEGDAPEPGAALPCFLFQKRVQCTPLMQGTLMQLVGSCDGPVEIDEPRLIDQEALISGRLDELEPLLTNQYAAFKDWFDDPERRSDKESVNPAFEVLQDVMGEATILFDMRSIIQRTRESFAQISEAARIEAATRRLSDEDRFFGGGNAARVLGLHAGDELLSVVTSFASRCVSTTVNAVRALAEALGRLPNEVQIAETAARLNIKEDRRPVRLNAPAAGSNFNTMAKIAATLIAALMYTEPMVSADRDKILAIMFEHLPGLTKVMGSTNGKMICHVTWNGARAEHFSGSLPADERVDIANALQLHLLCDKLRAVTVQPAAAQGNAESQEFAVLAPNTNPVLGAVYALSNANMPRHKINGFAAKVSEASKPRGPNGNNVQVWGTAIMLAEVTANTDIRKLMLESLVRLGDEIDPLVQDGPVMELQVGTSKRVLKLYMGPRVAQLFNEVRTKVEARCPRIEDFNPIMAAEFETAYIKFVEIQSASKLMSQTKSWLQAARTEPDMTRRPQATRTKSPVAQPSRSCLVHKPNVISAEAASSSVAAVAALRKDLGPVAADNAAAEVDGMASIAALAQGSMPTQDTVSTPATSNETDVTSGKNFFIQLLRDAAPGKLLSKEEYDLNASLCDNNLAAAFASMPKARQERFKLAQDYVDGIDSDTLMELGFDVAETRACILARPHWEAFRTRTAKHTGLANSSFTQIMAGNDSGFFLFVKVLSEELCDNNPGHLITDKDRDNFACKWCSLPETKKEDWRSRSLHSTDTWQVVGKHAAGTKGDLNAEEDELAHVHKVFTDGSTASDMALEEQGSINKVDGGGLCGDDARRPSCPSRSGASPSPDTPIAGAAQPEEAIMLSGTISGSTIVAPSPPLKLGACNVTPVAVARGSLDNVDTQSAWFDDTGCVIPGKPSTLEDSRVPNADQLRFLAYTKGRNEELDICNSKLPASERSAIIGAEWKNLSADERKKFSSVPDYTHGPKTTRDGELKCCSDQRRQVVEWRSREDSEHNVMLGAKQPAVAVKPRVAQVAAGVSMAVDDAVQVWDKETKAWVDATVFEVADPIVTVVLNDPTGESQMAGVRGCIKINMNYPEPAIRFGSDEHAKGSWGVMRGIGGDPALHKDEEGSTAFSSEASRRRPRHLRGPSKEERLAAFKKSDEWRDAATTPSHSRLHPEVHAALTAHEKLDERFSAVGKAGRAQDRKAWASEARSVGPLQHDSVLLKINGGGKKQWRPSRDGPTSTPHAGLKKVLAVSATRQQSIPAMLAMRGEVPPVEQALPEVASTASPSSRTSSVADRGDKNIAAGIQVFENNRDKVLAHLAQLRKDLSGYSVPQLSKVAKKAGVKDSVERNARVNFNVEDGSYTRLPVNEASEALLWLIAVYQTQEGQTTSGGAAAPAPSASTTAPTSTATASTSVGSSATAPSTSTSSGAGDASVATASSGADGPAEPVLGPMHPCIYFAEGVCQSISSYSGEQGKACSWTCMKCGRWEDMNPGLVSARRREMNATGVVRVLPRIHELAEGIDRTRHLGYEGLHPATARANAANGTLIDLEKEAAIKAAVAEGARNSESGKLDSGILDSENSDSENSNSGSRQARGARSAEDARASVQAWQQDRDSRASSLPVLLNPAEFSPAWERRRSAAYHAKMDNCRGLRKGDSWSWDCDSGRQAVDLARALANGENIAFTKEFEESIMQEWAIHAKPSSMAAAESGQNHDAGVVRRSDEATSELQAEYESRTRDAQARLKAAKARKLLRGLEAEAELAEKEDQLHAKRHRASASTAGERSDGPGSWLANHAAEMRAQAESRAAGSASATSAEASSADSHERQPQGHSDADLERARQEGAEHARKLAAAAAAHAARADDERRAAAARDGEAAAAATADEAMKAATRLFLAEQLDLAKAQLGQESLEQRRQFNEKVRELEALRAAACSPDEQALAREAALREELRLSTERHQTIAARLQELEAASSAENIIPASLDALSRWGPRGSNARAHITQAGKRGIAKIMALLLASPGAEPDAATLMAVGTYELQMLSDGELLPVINYSPSRVLSAPTLASEEPAEHLVGLLRNMFMHNKAGAMGVDVADVRFIAKDGPLPSFISELMSGLKCNNIVIKHLTDNLSWRNHLVLLDKLLLDGQMSNDQIADALRSVSATMPSTNLWHPDVVSALSVNLSKELAKTLRCAPGQVKASAATASRAAAFTGALFSGSSDALPLGAAAGATLLSNGEASMCKDFKATQVDAAIMHTEITALPVLASTTALAKAASNGTAELLLYNKQVQSISTPGAAKTATHKLFTQQIMSRYGDVATQVLTVQCMNLQHAARFLLQENIPHDDQLLCGLACGYAATCPILKWMPADNEARNKGDDSMLPTTTLILGINTAGRALQHMNFGIWHPLQEYVDLTGHLNKLSLCVDSATSLARQCGREANYGQLLNEAIVRLWRDTGAAARNHAMRGHVANQRVPSIGKVAKVWGPKEKPHFADLVDELSERMVDDRSRLKRPSLVGLNFGSAAPRNAVKPTAAKAAAPPAVPKSSKPPARGGDARQAAGSGSATGQRQPQVRMQEREQTVSHPLGTSIAGIAFTWNTAYDFHATFGGPDAYCWNRMRLATTCGCTAPGCVVCGRSKAPNTKDAWMAERAELLAAVSAKLDSGWRANPRTRAPQPPQYAPRAGAQSRRPQGQYAPRASSPTQQPSAWRRQQNGSNRGGGAGRGGKPGGTPNFRGGRGGGQGRGGRGGRGR